MIPLIKPYNRDDGHKIGVCGVIGKRTPSVVPGSSPGIRLKFKEETMDENKEKQVCIRCGKRQCREPEALCDACCDTDELLVERKKTHGDFMAWAITVNTMKDLFRGSAGYGRMSCMQKEAIDMICVKIGRILSGDPNHKDHWDDIAGYAKLGGRNY